MAMLRKAMLYLGLGPDEEYEEYDPAYDDGDGPDDGAQPHRQPQPQPAAVAAVAARPARSSVTATSGGSSSLGDEPSGIGAVRPIGGGRGDQQRQGRVDGPIPPALRSRSQVVRPITVTPNAKPQVVVPTSFNQAQEVADKFRGNQPVIVNMQSADRDLARRLIDFASGLCYGLGGQMEKVANQVYLLTPTNVEVSAEDRRRLQERNYDH